MDILRAHTSTTDIEDLCKNERKIFDTTYTTLKETQKMKFKKMIRERDHELYTQDKKEWFVNTTNTEIPANIINLLALGPKHALPTTKKQLPLFNQIADGEDCIHTLKEREQQEIGRIKLTTMLNNHTNKMRLTQREKLTLNTVEQTRKFLNKNKEIIILNADKGNLTVAMTKTDYKNKMNTILQDICTYRRMKKDPTLKLQLRNNTLVQKLHKRDLITNIEKYRLTTNTANSPRIFGLPKIHKEGIPLRPICSSINSPSHGLCRYITSILKNLTSNSIYNVKDAIDFKTRTNDSYIYDDEVMISFDVISLFPSIPINLAINILKSKWGEIEKFTKIPKDLFFDMVTFCVMDNRYFKYEDKIFEQTKGMPMGSPASPVIADIVMEELLDRTLEKLDKKPRLVIKYVDDLFCVIDKDMVDITLKTLNNFNSQIQFTTESEKDGRLPYLDTLVTKIDNILKIDWYKKPMASGRLINYFSKHPKTVIFNTAASFVRRTLLISDKLFHKKNIKTIRTILRKNDFPQKTITKMIIDFSDKRISKKTESMPKTYKSMTYIPLLSERIKHSDIYDRENISIAFRNHNTLQQLFTKTKSKIDKMEKSNLIYQIGCNGDGSNVCNKVYVGTTKTKLKTRLAAHKSDYRNRKLRDEQKTALSTHCAKHNHSPNLDAVRILQEETNYKKRFTLEMLHTIKSPLIKRINYKTDTDNCAHMYRLLVNKQNHC